MSAAGTGMYALSMDAARAKYTRARLQQKLRVHSLQYAAEPLRRDREVVISACLNHGLGALQHCTDPELVAELQGLKRGQLKDLLATSYTPKRLDPRDPWYGANDSKGVMPDDDGPTCLMCFDLGETCSVCAAKAAAESASGGSSSADAAALSRGQKKNRKKKGKKKLQHDEAEAAAEAGGEDEVEESAAERRSRTNNTLKGVAVNGKGAPENGDLLALRLVSLS